MAVRRAFLTYLGNRKWRRVRDAKAPERRNYLRYTGDRKWKRVDVDVNAKSLER